MTPCQKLQIQEGTARRRRSESMQQSSATQSLHLSFWGLRKIVACSHSSSSQCLLVSAVFGTVSSLHPTSFLMIFILVYICSAFSHAYTWPCIPWCNVCANSFVHVSCLNKCVCSVVPVYECRCIHVCSVYIYMYVVCHMKLFLHYPQQKDKQEAATDHKDSDVKDRMCG